MLVWVLIRVGPRFGLGPDLGYVPIWLGPNLGYVPIWVGPKSELGPNLGDLIRDEPCVDLGPY